MDRETRRRILIADASEGQRSRITAFLPPGYQCQEVADAAMTLARNAAKPSDCILLDEQLPGADGFALLDYLVNEGAAVIVLTDIAGEARGIEAVQRGAQDYFVKKYLNAGALARTIDHAIERAHLLRENRDAVARLREQQRQFEDVTSRIDEAMWLRDANNGEFLYLSPAFERHWGRSIRELLASGLERFFHPEGGPCHEQVMSAATPAWLADAPNFVPERYEYDVQEEFRIVRPKGEVRTMEGHSFPIRSDDGSVVRIGGIVRDVTEMRQQEQALRLAQKLEAIGQLAAGIAHEINTPSQYVSDNLAFLEEAMGELTPVLSAISQAMKASGGDDTATGLRALVGKVDFEFLQEEIPLAISQSREGIDQIKHIVLAMKDFSHPGDTLDAADLNQLIKSTVTVARNEWKYVADLKLDLDEELPFVSCIASALNQVVLNLVVNAAHAIGDANSGSDKGLITIQTRKGSQSDVIIQVTDDGPGIPEHIVGRIFDPFFTTKEVGKGTGQGLAIAYSVITDRHGGALSVESQVGHGTCFTIRLPIAAASMTAEEPAR